MHSQTQMQTNISEVKTPEDNENTNEYLYLRVATKASSSGLGLGIRLTVLLLQEIFFSNLVCSYSPLSFASSSIQ